VSAALLHWIDFFWIELPFEQDAREVSRGTHVEKRRDDDLSEGVGDELDGRSLGAIRVLLGREHLAEPGLQLVRRAECPALAPSNPSANGTFSCLLAL
jgi:hypothetical protein